MGGTIAGLVGTGLVLRLNGGNDLFVNPGATSFEFPRALPEGARYTATVLTQPSSPSQVCSLAEATASGTVGGANITDLSVTCLVAPPSIEGPSDQSVYVGQTATFSVVASGNGLLDYQWYRNDAPIAGATGASYTTPTTSEADDGSQFSVVVRDTYGGSTSSGSASGILHVRWSFEPTGDITTPRVAHSATLLPDGKVLIAGGTSSNGEPLSSAELYDPSTGSFTRTAGDMSVGRADHTATLLPSQGQVLVAGGFASYGTSGAELYDPSSRTFTETGSMTISRMGHTATLLSDGKVLIAGGSASGQVEGMEVYDPLRGAFASAGDMTPIRNDHAAIALPSGKVLIVGGSYWDDGPYVPLNTAQLYDPSSGEFEDIGAMRSVRWLPTATMLLNGKVLIAGGSTDVAAGALSSAELYTPSP